MTEQQAMRMALEALELVSIEFVCNGAHHAKKDRHEWLDPCPIVDRYKKAITALRQALESRSDVEQQPSYCSETETLCRKCRGSCQALEQQPADKSSLFDSGVYVGNHIGKEIKHTPFTLQPDDLKIDRETIIKLAMEAGLLHESDKAEIISECGVEVWLSPTDGVNTLERFANLIAQHEREEWAEEFAGLGEWNCVHIIEDRCK